MAEGAPDGTGPTGWWRRRAGDPGRESGTTITEVLVVLAATALLGVPLLAAVSTVTRVEDGRLDAHRARIDLAAALDAIEVDLVNATPVASRPAGADAADTLGLLVTDAAADRAVVYWTVARGGITRLEADPATLRVTGRSAYGGAVAAPATGAPFRYYDATGAELDPAVVGADHLADCTTLVEITLAVEIGDRVDSATSRRAIRPRSPGSNGC